MRFEEVVRKMIQRTQTKWAVQPKGERRTERVFQILFAKSGDQIGIPTEVNTFLRSEFMRRFVVVKRVEDAESTQFINLHQWIYTCALYLFYSRCL